MQWLDVRLCDLNAATLSPAIVVGLYLHCAFDYILSTVSVEERVHVISNH